MHNFDFIPKEVLDKIKDLEGLKKELEQGKNVPEIFGYNEDTMEKFYEVAHALYQQKLYKEASHAFVFLTFLNPYVPNYWLALGMSEQNVEEYEVALTSYAMALMLKSQNPAAYFHSATCLFALNENERAIYAMEQALDQSGDIEEFQEIKKQAKAVLRAKKKNSQDV